MKIKRTVAVFLLLALQLGSFPAATFAQTPTIPEIPDLPASTKEADHALPLFDQPAASVSKAKFPALDLWSSNLNSAGKRRKPSVQRLTKKEYRSDEEVSVAIVNPDRAAVQAQVLDKNGKEAGMEIDSTRTIDGEIFTIEPRTQFRPGKYKLVISDTQGNSSAQDFTWGVLAINTNRSIYQPGKTADLSIGVLDDYGNMVCDAKVELRIKNQELRIDDVLSTTEGKIKVNEQCKTHKFSLEPDYEAHYVVGGVGTYAMTLTAKTPNGTYTITDSFKVQEVVPFDVERVTATRIYPPHDYPVTFNITANQDFEGTITETVPDSFAITQAGSGDSYDTAKTLYLDENADPSVKLEEKVLGASTASTSGLLLPFTGSYPVTEGFGVQLTDGGLLSLYNKYGLAGHDGVDFAVPSGTPILASDDGEVIHAEKGDYGITVIIQHSWGRSYYGHLSLVTVAQGDHVMKGTKVALSGNTGESTGPHLHFGIKPNNPDMLNGYIGKVDPMPYMGLPSTATIATSQLTPHTPHPNPLPQGERGLLVNQSVLPLLLGEGGGEVRGEVAQGGILGASTSASFTLLDDQIRAGVLNAPTTSDSEKVKILSWHISLKKGEKTTLTYNFKAPKISPQFYLLGPLSFYSSSEALAQSRSNEVLDSTSLHSNNNELVFSEARQWQIAADALSAIKFMESGTDATQTTDHWDATDPGAGTGTMTTSTANSHTGPRSLKVDSGNGTSYTVLDKNSVLADSGTRISMYVNYTNIPTADSALIGIFNAGFVQWIASVPFIDTTGHLCMSWGGADPGQVCGTTVLQTGRWYHISLAYTITSLSVNQFRIYLNGSLEVSKSNATLDATSSSHVAIGWGDAPGASKVVYVDDVYVDDGSDLSDPGAIRVTNKRPNANGLFNDFTTQIGSGGSGYGSGHSPQLNEQPASTTNGWSRNVADVDERLDIESSSTGDVNISGADLVGYQGWIYTKTSNTTCSTPEVLLNGVQYDFTFANTDPVYKFAYVLSSSYPTDTTSMIGEITCQTETATISLYEAGVQFAFIGPTLNEAMRHRKYTDAGTGEEQPYTK